MTTIADLMAGYSTNPIPYSEEHISDLDPTISYVEKHVQYFNGTDYGMTVVDRTGVIHHIPKYYNANRKTFTVRTSWMFRRDMLDSFIEQMKGYHHLNSVELNQLMSCLCDMRTKTLSNVRAYLDYEIPQKMFTPERQSLYFVNHDMVLSTLPPRAVPFHPYSTAFTPNIKEFKIDISHKGNAFIEIEYVDNSKTKSVRYVNLCGSVQKVAPKQDINRGDGIYIYTKVKKLTSDSEYKVEKHHLTVEQADEQLITHKTHEEAQHGGDIKNVAKLKTLRSETELVDAKHELVKKQLEIERLSSEAKVKDHEFKMVREDLQRTHELLKAHDESRRLLLNNDLSNRKHEMEMRSIGKKEMFDLIKMIPGLVLVLGTAYVAIQKAKAST